jgi:hypothetical protein
MRILIILIPLFCTDIFCQTGLINKGVMLDVLAYENISNTNDSVLYEYRIGYLTPSDTAYYASYYFKNGKLIVYENAYESKGLIINYDSLYFNGLELSQREYGDMLIFNSLEYDFNNLIPIKKKYTQHGLLKICVYKSKKNDSKYKFKYHIDGKNYLGYTVTHKNKEVYSSYLKSNKIVIP